MTRPEKLGLISLVLVSFAFRVYILVNSRLSFYSDDAIYAEIARFWIQGRFDKVFHPTWSPLYPAVSALTFILIQNWEDALRLVSIIFGVLSIVPVYLVSRKSLPRVTSFVLCFVYGFASPIMNMSLYPQSDMLATFLLVVSLLLMYTGFSENKNHYFYYASFGFGLTYLTRQEGLAFFFLSLFYLTGWLLVKIFSRKLSVRTITLLPFTLLIFLMTTSPYWLVISHRSGTLSLSQKASAQIKQGHSFQLNKNGTTWIQEVVSVKSPNFTSEYFSGGLYHVLDYQDWYWFWFVQKLNIWKNIFLNNFPVWILPFMAIGILTFLRKSTSAGTYLILILISVIPATIFATPLTDLRYLAWTVPLFLFFVFLGIKTIFGRVSALATVLLVLFLPLISFKTIFGPQVYAEEFTKNHFREEIINAGPWLAQNTPRDTKIMIKHEGIEFYADAITIYFPQDLSLDVVLNYGRVKGAKYLIAWKEELFADKNLAILLSPKFKHTRLTKVFQYPTYDPEILIYEIDKP